jgi:hypothetical protein
MPSRLLLAQTTLHTSRLGRTTDVLRTPNLNFSYPVRCVSLLPDLRYPRDPESVIACVLVLSCSRARLCAPIHTTSKLVRLFPFGSPELVVVVVVNQKQTQSCASVTAPRPGPVVSCRVVWCSGRLIVCVSFPCLRSESAVRSKSPAPQIIAAAPAQPRSLMPLIWRSGDSMRRRAVVGSVRVSLICASKYGVIIQYCTVRYGTVSSKHLSKLISACGLSAGFLKSRY